MHDTSGLCDFFNNLSLSSLESLAELNLENISIELKLLEGIFEEDIKELKQKSVGNKTRTRLLSSINDVEFIVKAITDESSLTTQTEYVNHWIAKLILCQKSTIRLVIYLMTKIEHYQFHWNEYKEIDQSDTFRKQRQFQMLCDNP
ncbi:MAG: hypothetical protein WBX01_09095, partial [Nitrososphaeraceae archaeon]